MSINLAEIVNAEDMRADVRKLRKAREEHDKIALELEKDLLEEWASDFMWKYDDLIIRHLCTAMREHFVSGQNDPYYIPDEFINDAMDLHFANCDPSVKRAFAVALYSDLMSYNQIANKTGSRSCSKLGAKAVDALRELFAKRLGDLGYHFEGASNDGTHRCRLIPESFVHPVSISSAPHFGQIYLTKPNLIDRLFRKIKSALNRKTSRPFLGL